MVKDISTSLEYLQLYLVQFTRGRKRRFASTLKNHQRNGGSQLSHWQTKMIDFQ